MTHLCDDSLRDALDHFHGPSGRATPTAASLVPHNRQFSDEHIRELVQRDAVIGVAFDAWMLAPGGRAARPRRRRPVSRSATVIDHIDHICQLAGNAAARGDRIGSRRRVRHGAVSLRCQDDCRPVEAAGSCSSSAATASRTSSTSRTATSSGSCSRPGARPPRNALYVRDTETDSRSVSMTRGVRSTAQHFHSATGHGVGPVRKAVDATEVSHDRRHLRIVHVADVGEQMVLNLIFQSRADETADEPAC